MTRRLLAFACSGATLVLGLATVTLWNRNYAVAAECAELQRTIERQRVENERLALEALAAEQRALAPRVETGALSNDT